MEKNCVIFVLEKLFLLNFWTSHELDFKFIKPFGILLDLDRV